MSARTGATRPSPWRAVFFDRDGTLARQDPAVRDARARRVQALLGFVPQVSYAQMMNYFEKLGFPPNGLLRLEDERMFWARYEAHLLKVHGYQGDCTREGAALAALYWLKPMALYKETLEVLDYFRKRGFLLGVISDTSISLAQTLEATGIRSYFDVVMSSAQAGHMKPDPHIYQAALAQAGILPGQALYVDDTREEADAARALGMTAFHLDRGGQHGQAPWTIATLQGLVHYIEAQED